MIETKKKLTFENNVKSKVLMMCATQNEAKKTDVKMHEAIFEGV